MECWRGSVASLGAPGGQQVGDAKGQSWPRITMNAAQSVRERHRTAASTTLTRETTKPTIHPDTLALSRMAPMAVPMPATPAVAIHRTAIDSVFALGGEAGRKPGSTVGPDICAPAEWDLSLGSGYRSSMFTSARAVPDKGCSTFDDSRQG